MVALVPTFKRSTDLIRFWKMSKLDGVLWVVTVTFVIFAGVDSGLLFGVIVGLLLTLFRLAMYVSFSSSFFNLIYYFNF